MTIRANNTAIVSIDCSKGIDGSVAIPNIQNGYCIEMENADLSSAGVWKARSGYEIPYEALPTRTSLLVGTTYTCSWITTAKTATCSAGLQVLNSTGLTYLDKVFGYQTERSSFLGTYYVLCVLDSGDAEFAAKDLAVLTTYGIGAITYSIAKKPIKYFGNGVYLFPRYVDANTRLKDFTYSGTVVSVPSLPILEHVTGVSLTELTKVAIISTVECLPVGTAIFEPILGSGSVTSVTAGVSITVTFSNTFPTGVTGTYLVFYYSVGFSNGYSSNLSTMFMGPAALTLLTETTYSITSAAIGTNPLWLTGTGITDGRVQGLESYFGISANAEKLMTIYQDSCYAFTETMNVGYYTETPAAFNATVTPTAIAGGLHTLAYAVADATVYYQIGDTVSITRQNSTTGVTTKYEMIVTAVATNLITVSGTVPSSISSGEYLQYTRSSRIVMMSNTSSAYRAGNVISFGTDQKHEILQYYTTGGRKYLYFKYPVTWSSGILTYIGVDHFAMTTGLVAYWSSNTAKNAENTYSTAPFYYNSFIAHPMYGVTRFDGTTMLPSRLYAPIVLASRSIPGTRGQFPITRTTNDKKIGLPVYCVFSFTFYDANGLKTESEYTDYDEGIFTPNACTDGSDYSELLEVKIQVPYETLTGSGTIYLNAYVTTTNPTSNTEQSYCLYKTIPLVESAVTYAKQHQPVLVTLGEIPPGTLTGQKLQKTSAVQPALFKYLTVAANRLIALNSWTKKYVTVKPTSVFDPSGQFAAFFKFSLTATDSGVSRSTCFSAPLGVINTLVVGVPTTALIPGSTKATTGPSDTLTNTYPVTLPTYAVYPLDYKDVNVSKSLTGTTIARTDISDTFRWTGVAYTYAVITVEAKAVFRRADRSKNLSGLSIDLEGDSFKYERVGGTYYKYTASTRWTDGDLDPNGVPNVLKDQRFFTACKLTVGGVPVEGGKRAEDNAVVAQILVTKSDTGYAKITLRTNETYLANATYGAAIIAEYLVIKGVGNLFSLTVGDSGEQVSFDRDLIFKAGAGAVSGGYCNYDLTPYLTGGYDSAAITLKAVQLKSAVDVGDTISSALDGNVFISLYSGALANIATFTNFSLLTNTLTVSKATIGDTLYAVGQYVTFELTTDDAARSSSLGRLEGVPWKVTAVASGVLTLQSVPMVLPGAPSVNNLSANSYLVITSKLFDITTNPGYLTTKIVSGVTVSGASFLLVRGEAPESTSLALSGPCQASNHVGNVIRTTLLFSIPTDIYKSISGVKYACLVVSSDAYSYPIPVPRHLSTGTWQDLALPLYTDFYEVAEDPFTQITKRVCSVLSRAEYRGSFYGADTLSLSAAEFSITTDVDTTATCVFAGSTANFLINGAPVTVSPVTLTRDTYGARVMWTDEVLETNAFNAVMASFRRDYVKDLITDDDPEITGACAVQDGIVVFKSNSVIYLSFGSDGTVSTRKLQTTVGGTSHFNLPTNTDGAYFVHTTGVYFTDGTKVDNIFKLGRQFQDRVNKSTSVLALASGYTDTEKKEVHIGVPYQGAFSDPLTVVDGQFVYCYNDGVLGWTANTHIDAYKWTRANGRYYFASNRGRVFKMRSETSLTRYRDAGDTIPFGFTTRYLTAEEETRFKFWRNIIFRWGDTSTFTMNVWYSIDFKTTLYPLNTYPIAGGTKISGQVAYGTNQFLKMQRETFGQRVSALSFTVTCDARDADCPVYGISAEGWLHNTRLVSQKLTPGGNRT